MVFSSVVSGHWLPADARHCRKGAATVLVDSALSAHRSVSLLRVEGGPTILSLSPARANEFELSDGECIDRVDLSDRLERAGVTLNDPDYLFYVTLNEQVALRDEPRGGGTRELTNDDIAAFAAFVAETPDDDLDEAFVELEHWLVFGAFENGKLVSVASMYPWGGTQLADLGVITLPGFRGRGLGRTTVRAISAAALARGYEPQYRCQLDNADSVSLARSAGFALFGQWEILDTDD